VSDKPDHKLHLSVDTKFSEFKGVIVDGANILTKSKTNEESVVVISRLTKLLNIVEALGWQTLIGLKNDSYYWMIKRSNLDEEGVKTLKTMVKSGSIDLIDDQEDDYHLINVAINGPYYLLSHDMYRDWKKSNPSMKSKIERCHIKVNWLGDEPSFTLPANGKSTVIVRDNNEFDGVALSCNTTNEVALTPIGKNIGRGWLKTKFNHELFDYISNQHFRLLNQNGKLFIEDLTSSNGTYINGFKLPPNHPQELGPDGKFNLSKKLDFSINLLSK
jgi:hypothetical protein